MITLRHRRRARQDDIVPMINVAFLLLVFFLMSAVFATPAPVDVAAPTIANAPRSVHGVTLFVVPGGGLVRADGVPVQNLNEFAGGPVSVSADAMFPANSFVRIVKNLQIAGVTDIRLVARNKLK